MTSEITLRADLDCGRWDSFVRSHAQGTFFHLSGWSQVQRSAFGHRTHGLSLLRGEKVVGVLPLTEVRSLFFGRALVSNGFCVGGGPLAESEETRDQLLRGAEELGREIGADYVEVRDVRAARAGWRARENLYASFSRPIAKTEEECLKQIPRKQRAVVRKALETNYSVTVDRDVDVFFDLYARTVRNHGTPAFPKRYIKQLLATFGDDCDILTIWDGRAAFSSVLSFYYRDRVLPYYTGSTAGARERGANDLMYWCLMRHAIGRGCSVFDFGRSKVGTGPYAFKKNWGFEPRPISNYYFLMRGQPLPNNNPTNPKFGPAIKLWRMLPVPLATFLSQVVSKDLA